MWNVVVTLLLNHSFTLEKSSCSEATLLLINFFKLTGKKNVGMTWQN